MFFILSDSLVHALENSVDTANEYDCWQTVLSSELTVNV